jgi:proteasome lid subunit RPN8/RPN11
MELMMTITKEPVQQQDRVEFYWALLGEVRPPIWFCRKAQATKTKGEPASVTFDHKWVLDREEKYSDVVGFYHTHPGMSATPSVTDHATMRAWVCAFGKPLLCVIRGKDGVRAYIYWDDESDPEELEDAEEFKQRIIIGVENCEEEEKN